MGMMVESEHKMVCQR